MEQDYLIRVLVRNGFNYDEMIWFNIEKLKELCVQHNIEI